MVVRPAKLTKRRHYNKCSAHERNHETRIFRAAQVVIAMIRLGLGLIWLLHFLPLPVLARLGDALGMLLYALARARRRVVLLNLQFCFPELERSASAGCLRAGISAPSRRSVIEHGILWWGSKARVQTLVQIEGLEHWRALAGRPVILLAPHFVGLDMGGIRLAAEYRLNSVYSRTKDAVFDDILIHGRTRFGQTTLFARQDGIRPMVKIAQRRRAVLLPAGHGSRHARLGVRAVFRQAGCHHHRAFAHRAAGGRGDRAVRHAPVAGRRGLRRAPVSGVGRIFRAAISKPTRGA